MESILRYIELIEDGRQQAKVKHKLIDIVVIVLFAKLANANDWIEIADFAECHIEFLRKYIELANGVPSHDTIQRVMGMINPAQIQRLYEKWNEMLNTNEGEKLKKIICIDGKTMRGNKVNDIKPQHVVSAWCDEDGFCFGQKVVEEKSNEITAIPKLLESINIKNCVVTIDAMGTQKEIAELIKSKRAQYVLCVKGNQHALLEEIKEYFDDKEFLGKIKANNGYKMTLDNCHSQVEKREHYQTNDIKWMNEKGKWSGLKTIGMVKKTITKGEKIAIEIRYYISNMPVDIDLFSRAVRQHWSVEVMHWHLDVTFKEDANKTIDRIAAQNLNIINKWCLSILKIIEIGGKKRSLAKKRYNICMNAEKHLEAIMNL